MTNELRPRVDVEHDLPGFFEFQRYREARCAAAFTTTDPGDRDAFTAHWHWRLANPTTVNPTLVWEGRVWKIDSSFQVDGKSEATYYVDTVDWYKEFIAREIHKLLHLLLGVPRPKTRVVRAKEWIRSLLEKLRA